MSTTTNQDYKALAARVRGFQKQASTPEATDPTEKGATGNPTDPHATSAKLGLTANKENAPAAPALTDRDTNPSETGKNVPSVVDGTAKDTAVSSPTDPLSKIASQVKSVLGNIASLRGETVKTAGVAAQAAAPTAEQVKAANDKLALNGLENGPDFLIKLATAMIATEEGVSLVTSHLTKQAGREVANGYILKALDARDGLLQLAQEEINKQASADQNIAIAQEMFKQASAPDQAKIVKFANVHSVNLQARDAYPVLKMGYMQGAADAQDMADAGVTKRAAAMDPAAAGGGDPAAAMAGGDPSAAGGAPAGPDGGMGELPGAQGPVSDEEVVQMIMQLVQEGQLQPDVAKQVIQELEAGAAGGGATGGDPSQGGDPAALAQAAAASGAGGADPSAGPEKQASAKGQSAAELVAQLVK